MAHGSSAEAGGCRRRRLAGGAGLTCSPLKPLLWLLPALWLAPTVARALEVLDEEELAAVQAQSGVTLNLTQPGSIGVQSLVWHTDDGGPSTGTCSGGLANQQACTVVAPVLSGAGGNPLTVTARLDVGSNGQPGLGLRLDWQPLLLQTARLTLATPTADYRSQTLGQFGLYSQGALQLDNLGGFFNNSGNTAHLRLASSGDLIYRNSAAGSPELSFANLVFNTRFSSGAAGGQGDATGRVAIDNQGLLLSAPYAQADLLFDLMYKGSPTGFDTSGRQALIKFGWSGGLANPLLRLSAGGVGYGSYAAGGATYYDIAGSNGGGARSQGLNVLASWDFDSDFAWIIGQAGGNGTQARFTNWRRLGASSGPMLSMPIALDVLQNGVGPAGLCFGGGFAGGSPVQASCTAAGGTWVAGGVPVGKAALATLIRDGHLLAYNQQIEVRDPTSATPTSVYDWSLLYTYGKLDSDIYLYPEGRNPGATVSSNGSGLKADITLTAQSPGFWDKANSTSAAVRATAGAGWASNTHFMVADTKVGGVAGQQYGVGLVNADLLWSVRDLYFRVVTGDSAYPLLPGGLWLQTDTSAVYQFRGLLGGGNLLDLSAPTAVALMDLKLSTNRFLFTLNPKAPVSGDAAIGFNGLLDLDGNAYLSLGEVSSPASTFRLYDVQGRIGWRDGSVNLVSGQNSADGLPKLAIANDLLFGKSANFLDPGSATPAGAGAPLVAKVGFGSENFGRIALPGGVWHSEVSLKIPGN